MTTFGEAVENLERMLEQRARSPRAESRGPVTPVKAPALSPTLSPPGERETVQNHHQEVP